MKVVYGARDCVWWDTIDNAGRTPPRAGVSIPCCPHCGSVLFEVPSEQDWFAAVDKYEAQGHPGYRALIEWARGKCFPNHALTKAAYKVATGKSVD